MLDVPRDGSGQRTGAVDDESKSQQAPGPHAKGEEQPEVPIEPGIGQQRWLQDPVP